MVKFKWTFLYGGINMKWLCQSCKSMQELTCDHSNFEFSNLLFLALITPHYDFSFGLAAWKINRFHDDESMSDYCVTSINLQLLYFYCKNRNPIIHVTHGRQRLFCYGTTQWTSVYKILDWLVMQFLVTPLIITTNFAP